MEYNQFEINAFTTNDINSIPVEAGYIHLDSYYEKPWTDTLTHVIAYDNTYNKDITQADILYTNGHPADCVAYENIDKTKYYWDTLNQDLYFFEVVDSDNPWYIPEGTYKAVDGLPPMVVNIHIEFDPDALYFDKTTDTADIYAWSEEDDWYIVHKVCNIDVDPETEFTYDLDTLDKEAYYYNRAADKIYGFNYGVYFQKIDYTGIILEKMFEFYERLQHNFIDYNDIDRVNHRDFIYTGGHPSKNIVNPDINRIYYDSKNNKVYRYDGITYNEIRQDCAIIPHSIFY